MHPYQSVLAHLATGGVIITPNNRLSREVLAHFTALQPNACLEKPRVFSYPEFLRKLFLETQLQCPEHPHPVLLSPIHLRKLWRQALATSETTCTEGLLQALINAWALCHAWQVNLEDSAFQELTQHQHFLHWVHTVEHQLNTLNAISEYHLPAYLQPHLSKLKLPHTLVWFCFDDYTPAQHHLQETFQTLGSIVLTEDLTQHHVTPYQLDVEEMKDEYIQLCAWLKEKQNPLERIGIVVPTLEDEAQTLTRSMSREFNLADINISFGQPLSDYPIVAHALAWLTLDLKAVTQHQLRLLFTSPYLGKAPQEYIQRAQWMHDLPLFFNESIKWDYLIQKLPASAFKTSLQALKPYPTTATISEWLSHFEHRLTQLGFPGDAELDSMSYQCLQRLIHLFDEFRLLKLLSSTLTQQDALDTLQELAQISNFQPERQQATIHILGLLEASGCTFDHLWVMHMTDQTFPQQGQCSAFIPISLQKKLNMPHANHTREMRYATQTFQRLLAGSTSQIFSYARFNNDSPSLPSPFLKHLPHAPKASVLPITTHQRQSFDDNYHLPLASYEKIGGGTTLLANQAKCQFRAFAAHRLHLKNEHDISEGLNPKERGQILHQILEKFWQHVQSQQQLLTLSQASLKRLLEDLIIEVLTPFTQIHDDAFPPVLQTLEIQRLTQLLLACLDFEKTRPSFRIEALEQNAEITLAGLTFKVKLDRLDQLETGEKWVIDYKSRLPTQKPWNEERPEEPQLLLYALLDASIRGMMFIELRHGHIQCAGLTDGTTLLGMHHLKEEQAWDAEQARWHAQLTELAEEFQTGHCYPTPTRTSLCSTCEFKPLCRIL